MPSSGKKTTPKKNDVEIASYKSPSGKKPKSSEEDLASDFGHMHLGQSDDEQSSLASSAETTTDSKIIEETFGSYEAPELGTRKYPHVEYMWPKHPHRNRFFETTHVSDYRRNGWKRQGFHLRFGPIVFTDHDKWTGHWPTENEFPPFQDTDRCYLVRRPAFSGVQRFPELVADKLPCEATAEALQGQKQELEDKNAHVWHLIVYPIGYDLSNTHFAGADAGGNVVPTGRNPVKIAKNHSENGFDKELGMLCVHWDVAFKHGGIKLPPTKPDPQDLKNMF